MKVGDLVTAHNQAGMTPITGILLSEPFVTFDGQTEVVRVEWIGWNLREDYATQYLKVLTKKDVNNNNNNKEVN